MDTCTDNRFLIIERAKNYIIEHTNIEIGKEEMKVLDSFLFRIWQLGWLKRFDYEADWAFDIAGEMLNALIYDNDMMPWESEIWDARSKIAKALEPAVYQLGKSFFTDEMIDTFCIGEDSEMKKIVDDNPVLEPVHILLEEFFDNGCITSIN